MNFQGAICPRDARQKDRRRISAVRASYEEAVRDRAFSAHTDFQPIP